MEEITPEKSDEVFEQAFEPGYQLDKERRDLTGYRSRGRLIVKRQESYPPASGMSILKRAGICRQRNTLIRRMKIWTKQESRARLSCYASANAVLSLATRKAPSGICSGCTGY